MDFFIKCLNHKRYEIILIKISFLIVDIIWISIDFIDSEFLIKYLKKLAFYFRTLNFILKNIVQSDLILFFIIFCKQMLWK